MLIIYQNDRFDMVDIQNFDAVLDEQSQSDRAVRDTADPDFDVTTTVDAVRDSSDEEEFKNFNVGNPIDDFMGNDDNGY